MVGPRILLSEVERYCDLDGGSAADDLAVEDGEPTVGMSGPSPPRGGDVAEFPVARQAWSNPTDARGPDRSELGVFLFTAEQYDHQHAAPAVLLGLNGLRVSEACATNIEDLGLERGHRILCIVGKGNKPTEIPLVPRTERTIDLAVGERYEGPILRRRDGPRFDRRTVRRRVRSIGKQAGLTSTPTCSGPRSSWPPLTPASRCAT